MQFTTDEIIAMPRIGVLPTMPTRADGFDLAVASILPQVDQLYIYLDGFDSTPVWLTDPKIVIRTATQHASSRFTVIKELKEPSVILSFDDDIVFPKDFSEVMVRRLSELEGQAVLGVHGRVFGPPHKDYLFHARCFHYAHELKDDIHVHEIGSGAMAYISSLFDDMDISFWPSNFMNDICFAIEAQMRDLPRVIIKRQKFWLAPIAEDQEDSIWQETKRHHSMQDELMTDLLKLY